MQHNYCNAITKAVMLGTAALQSIFLLENSILGLSRPGLKLCRKHGIFCICGTIAAIRANKAETCTSTLIHKYIIVNASAPSCKRRNSLVVERSASQSGNLKFIFLLNYIYVDRFLVYSQKIVITGFLLGAWHKRDGVKNKQASLLLCP